MRKMNICSLVLIKILMELWRLGNTGYKKKDCDERMEQDSQTRLANIHSIRPHIHL